MRFSSVLFLLCHPRMPACSGTIWSSHVVGLCGGTVKPLVSARRPFVTTRKFSSSGRRLENRHRHLRAAALNHSCFDLKCWKDRCITLSFNYTTTRCITWGSKTNGRSVEFNGLSDLQEEAAKAAILDKVMKGRQPTDLMLRCEPCFSE